MITQIYRSAAEAKKEDREEIADFLCHHLENFGDPLEDIGKAIAYALQEHQSPGGLIITMKEGDKMLGATVLNKTGMKDYIPENILVYIATHKEHRGQGIGKRLMQQAIEHAEGAIALHVEHDNPAKKLYEKLGFTNKYLEMRLTK